VPHGEELAGLVLGEVKHSDATQVGFEIVPPGRNCSL
jgi:hypothetical protein